MSEYLVQKLQGLLDKHGETFTEWKERDTIENAIARIIHNAAALREADETIEYNVKKRLDMQDELTRLHTENQQLRAENERLRENDAVDSKWKDKFEDYSNGLKEEIQQLRAENERLKGKIVSPDVTTMCYCDDCGAATRWGRHLDIDCETIKSLRDLNIIHVTTISGLHEQIGKLRAEVERFQNIFSPDVSIEMLEEGLQARAELHKLRAELEAAKYGKFRPGDKVEAFPDQVVTLKEPYERIWVLEETTGKRKKKNRLMTEGSMIRLAAPKEVKSETP